MAKTCQHCGQVQGGVAVTVLALDGQACVHRPQRGGNWEWLDPGWRPVETDQSPGMSIVRDVVLLLDYMVGQITSEELRWKDSNYDRDSALGRELLFLIADSEWSRATSEKIPSNAPTWSIRRSRSMLTLTGLLTRRSWAGPGISGFRSLSSPAEASAPGTGSSRLANRQRRQRDPAGDPSERRCPAPHRRGTHRNHPQHRRIPADRSGKPRFHPARDHRLLLSAAIFRLLRGEQPPAAVMLRTVPVRPPAGGPSPRIGRAQRELGELLWSSVRLLNAAGPSGHDDAAGMRFSSDHYPARRVIEVLRAFAESAVVVVAVERRHIPTGLSVTVPSRPLHQVSPGADGTAQLGGRTTRSLAGLAWRRLLRPAIWIPPSACVQIDMLLPSADADRQIQVSLPDGVSCDPSRPLAARAQLDIRSGQPPLVGQLADLTSQLARTADGWPQALSQCLADLAADKAHAVQESLRDHRVGTAPGKQDVTARESLHATDAFRDRLDRLVSALRHISACGQTAGARSELDAAWGDGDGRNGGDWLKAPMWRQTSADPVSPDVVVARARMIEDASQRATPAEARFSVHIAVPNAGYYSTTRTWGFMSLTLMTVVLLFLVSDQVLGFRSRRSALTSWSSSSACLRPSRPGGSTEPTCPPCAGC